jgi:SAM-dependent methyltransferase
MASTTARYESVANWYGEYTKDWGREPLALLPDKLTGQRVLDLGCGNGRITPWLAERGARATGVELSIGLLEQARQAEAARPLGIRYLQGDATNTQWWDGEPFDGVLCHMALMDIDDLPGALSTVASVLVPGGWFSFSIFHPCFPGGEAESWSGLPSWPPEHGYAHEGWWNTDGTGIRGHVGGNHRMLGTYLNALLAAGLVPQQFAERGVSLPAILLGRCRRVG